MSNKNNSKPKNKNRKTIPKVPIYKKIIRNFWQILRKPKTLAIIFIALGAITFFKGGSYKFVSNSVKNSYFYFSKSTGLVIEHIYQEGLKNTHEEQLIKALDIKMGQPLLSINVNNIRKNVEALPWIKYATVELQYPSTLSVRMIEHHPVALWQNQGDLKLIDINGIVIEEQNLKPFSDKVILVGHDVPENTEKFITMINMFDNINKLVSSATRVSNRRWDVYLKENILIKLPENNPEIAWGKLSQLHKDDNILSGNIKSIDLKLEDKIFIKNKI